MVKQQGWAARLLTYEIEAEDCKSQGSKQREDTVQLGEDIVEEGVQWRIREDVGHNLSQPQYTDNASQDADGKLHPKHDDCDNPHIIRIFSLQPSTGNH